MSDLPQIVIYGNLGAGDSIVCNAILRHYAKTHSVFALCKKHNIQSLNFMTRDVRNIEWLIVDGDSDALDFCALIEKEGYKVLNIGMFGPHPFNPAEWDKSHFAAAGVPFEDRWSKWKVVRQPSRELKPPEGPFCFVHEDASRGFVIDRQRLPENIPWVFAEPGLTQNLFDWTAHIEQATEIHMIDSCFAILADSLTELKAKRMVVHLYARAGALPPTYGNQKWEVIH